MNVARRHAVAILALAALFAVSDACAGGPLVVATDGSAVGWDTRAPVPYRIDRGGLGVLSNIDATALVDSLFGRWTDVPTATIGFTRAGTLAVDVDGTNFGPFLGPYGGAVIPRRRQMCGTSLGITVKELCYSLRVMDRQREPLSQSLQGSPA